MKETYSISRVRIESRTLAIFGLLGAAILGIREPDQFYRSYLFAYRFCLGIGLGCLGFLLLHSLTGGAWGNTGRRVFRAGANTLPWLGFLFLPILFGLRRIYPWLDPMQIQVESAAAAHKQLYFQPSFFMLRALGYFLIWSWMAHRRKQSAGSSAFSLLIFVLTTSFASFDWLMSLEPRWSSSIYGVMLLVGDGLSALAFTVLTLQWRERVDKDTAQDLGNLMLAFVMLWTYMSLSQYLIIWYANLPEEITWYLARSGGWQAVTVILVLFQFVLPFFLLLARNRKRDLGSLARVAGLILVLRVVDTFWLIAPDFSPGQLTVHALDAFLLMIVGGAWLSVFCTHLETEEAA